MDRSDLTWQPAPASLALPENEVHVWRVYLPQVGDLFDLLSPDEQTRAKDFRLPLYRERFIAARGVLRLLLSRYLGTAPQELSFAQGSQGKPLLTGPHQAAELRFNLSHSHSLALYAIARSREVGIDVERLRPQLDVERLASRFLAAEEKQRLQELPPEERLQGFFNAWTRKEAYLKALGRGIALPLHTFAVSLKPDEPAILLRCDFEPGGRDRWQLQALDPGPGYTAAVCAQGKDWQLRCWQWPGQR